MFTKCAPSGRLASLCVRKAFRQAGLRHLSVERFAGQRLLHDLARLDQPVEIDAGVKAERLGQEHRVLSYNVAGRARRERAAAEAAERSIEMAHADFDGG